MKAPSIVAISIFLLMGCTRYQKVTSRPEIVMDQGMRITARTPSGSITIIANEGYERTLQWGNCEKTLTLRPRRKRFMGMKGIIYPGSGITWLFGCDGIHRAIVREEQMPLRSEKELLEFVHLYKTVPYLYTNSGLMVGWLRSEGEMLLEVYQILINGEKPTHLEGANDSSIQVDLSEVDQHASRE